MKYISEILKVLTIVASIELFFCSQATAEKAKPNILFGIMDDASPHMGAYGYKWCKTLAFARLAKEGILFTKAYTPNAKCAPSRSSPLTGRHSWQLVEAADHVVNFPKTCKTFPEVLREQGYATALTGKGWGPGNPGTIDGRKTRACFEMEMLLTATVTQILKGGITTNALWPENLALKIPGG